jgi:hypothetical protein
VRGGLGVELKLGGHGELVVARLVEMTSRLEKLLDGDFLRDDFVNA